MSNWETRYYFASFLRGDAGSFGLGYSLFAITATESNPTAEFGIELALDSQKKQAKHTGIVSWQEVSEQFFKLNKVVGVSEKLNRCNSCGTIDKTGERVVCEKCMRPF